MKSLITIFFGVAFATSQLVGQSLPQCAIYTPSGNLVTLLGIIQSAPNAANGVSNGVVAPGEIVTLQGISFTYQTKALPAVATPQNGEYPIEFLGTTAYVNGVPAPILNIGVIPAPLPFAWTMQIQIPYDLDLTKSATIQLQMTQANNTQCIGPAETFSSVPVNPGIYMSPGPFGNDGSSAIVQNDGKGYLTFYMGGLGQLAIPVITGSITTGANELDSRTSVNVFIDNTPVSTSYAGLTPATVGVYQVNAMAVLAAGQHTLKVVVDGQVTTASFTSQ